MLRTIHTVSSLLLGIGLLLMGLALLGTSLGVRAVSEGFADASTGMIMASYFAGFIAGSYLCPGMIMRIGPIRSYAALAAIASFCTFMHALLIDPFAWALLRLIIGTCMVGLYMVIESWLNSITTNERRAGVFSIYMIVTLGAHAAGQFLLLLDTAAQVTAFGIAAAFISLGLVPVALTKVPQPEPVPAPRLQFRQLIKLSPLSLAGSLTGGLTTSSFWAMGAVFAQRIGMDGGEIVAFMVVTIIGGMLLQWPIGRLSDNYDRRIVLLLVCAAAALAALITSLLYHYDLNLLYLCLFFLGGLIFPIYAMSVAYLNDSIQSSDALEASRSMLLVYGIGAFLGPLLAGLVMTLSGPAGLFYYLVLVLCAFVIFAVFMLRTTSAVPAGERSTYIPMTRTSQVALELDPRLEDDSEAAEKSEKS